MSSRHSEENIGASWEQIADHRLLTREEEYELGRRVQAGGPDGDEARRELVRMNVRLAYGIALKFLNRGMETDDLVSEAMIGLDVAARRYDPARGNRFSTVATMWVFQRLQRAVVNQGQTIRLPDQLKRVRLTHANYPELTVEELAARCKTTPARVRLALGAAHVATSLDEPKQRDDGESGTGYDQVADLNADDPSDVREESGWVRAALDELPDDQREVVVRTFGFDGGGERTLPEVAEEVGLPLQAVKALHVQALARLKDLALAS